MHRHSMNSVIILVLLNLSFLSIIKTEIIPICETLKDVQGYEDGSSLKLRRVRTLCDGLQSFRAKANEEDSDLIPDFDLNQIDSENDANQILKRFRRGRSSGGGRSSSSSGSRFSSSSSRSSSSGGSRFFGGSRSSSSSSGGSSRIFSRSGSSSSSSSSGSGGGISSRGGTSGTSSHRVREAIRSVIRKPTSSGSGSSGLSGTGGSKPGLTDKIRKITHGSGSGSRFGSGGISGSHGGFGTGGSSGTGGNVWVRTGKTFLPHAVRFGKRYYQRRKYNKGMYAGMGAGAGYYAGSHMNNHHGHHYPYNNYGYPPDVDNSPTQIDGQKPTVFYCLQQDLNTTLVNETLDAEGFGICNISGKLITCPIEIECKTSEADNCCEDEQGTPYCCGGPIPVEYISQNAGYGDDWRDATESLNKILNIITAIWIMMATICFTIWQRRE